MMFDPFIKKEKQNSKQPTGLGTASVCQPLANEEGLEKENYHQSRKEGQQRKQLCGRFDGAFSRQMTGLAAVVAVYLGRFTALHCNMPDLATPVTLDFVTQFLDVSEPSAGVALLLIGMVTVSRNMAGFAAVVAALLSFLFGFFTISGNMSTPMTIIACILGLFAIPCNVALLSTPVTEEILSSAPSSSATTTSIRTVFDPVS